MENLSLGQQFQIDNIDKAIELIREVQNFGQWETLRAAKEELYKARSKILRGYEQAEKRKNNNDKN